MPNRIALAPACLEDVQSVYSLVSSYSDDESVFQKSQSEISNNIHDYILAKEQDSVVGSVEIHNYGKRITEISALVVAKEYVGNGIGAMLVKECIDRCAGDEILWLATIKPDYFSRFGFVRISKWSLPIRVLLYKLGQVFEQPPRRWIPSILGQHTFMRLDRYQSE